MASCGDLPTACFFFSSRRRHTRLSGDWSSDVCSSDLADIGPYALRVKDDQRGGLPDRNGLDHSPKLQINDCNISRPRICYPELSSIRGYGGTLSRGPGGYCGNQLSCLGLTRADIVGRGVRDEGVDAVRCKGDIVRLLPARRERINNLIGFSIDHDDGMIFLIRHPGLVRPRLADP